MSAANIASLTLGGASSIPTLTLSAGGFNVIGATTFADTAAEALNINSGGVMTNASFNMVSRAVLVTVNSGGIITNGSTSIANNGSADGGTKLTINSGATVNLGAVSIGRHNDSSTIGLQIAGGAVSASSIDIGSRNSYSTMAVAGGTVTNTGNLRLGTAGGTGGSTGRNVRYNQTGGSVGVAGTVDIAVGNNYSTWFSVAGAGSIFSAAGVRIFPNATTVDVARFTNSATIYLGASGFNVLNPAAGTYSVIFSNGLVGASADWSGNVNATLPSGTVAAFSPADLSGGHTIALSGVLSGAGGLLVTNAGTLRLVNTNTYSGNTTILTGTTLQLGDGVSSNGVVTGFITNSGTLAFANPNSQAIFGTNVVGGALVKTGAGTLVWLGTNTTISSVIINSGIFQLGDGATTAGAIPVNVTANLNGTFAVANQTAQTLTTLVSGAGSFAKSGPGTLTLGVNEPYAGSTVVGAGSLVVGSGNFISSTQSVTIASGASFDVSASTTGSYKIGSGYVFTAGHTSGSGPDFVGNLTNNGTINVPAASTLTLSGTLSLLNGGSNVFNLGTTPSSGSTIALTGGGALNLSGTTTLQVNFSILGVGTYPLISGASSVSGTTNNFNLILNGSLGLSTATLQVTSTGVNLVVAGNPHNLVWLGDGAANSWDNVAGNTDWSNVVTHAVDFFATGHYVTFNDIGAANPPVINAVVTPATVTINGSSSYTFTGSGYINSGTLTNNSSGTLSVQTANTYSGGTTINAGTVEVGTGGAIGTGPVVNNAALSFNRTDNGTNLGPISGSGTVTVQNSGIETLSAANSYTGGTTISAPGTLRLGAADAIPGGIVAGDVALNGTLDLAAFSDTINGLSGSGAVDTLAGGSPTLTVGGNGNGGTFNGLIQNTTGALNLKKSGSGIQTLGSANTYSGSTTIANGVLALGVSQALPSGTAVILGGTGTAGALDLAGFNQQVAGLAVGSGAISYNQIIGNSSASPSTLIYSNTATATFGGTIRDVLGAGSSTVALTVNGSSLVLNGTNNYSGVTTVSGGNNAKLTVSGGSLAGTTLTMNNGAGSQGFLLSAGTASFSSNAVFGADNGNNVNSMQITGGTLNVSNLLSGRTSLNTPTQPTTGQTTTLGIYISGSPTVNITNRLGIGAAGANSSASFRMDGGTVNVGGTTTITINNGTRWTVMDVNGGTFTSTDTNGAGIQIGGVYAATEDVLLIRAGTVSANAITFGDATQTSGSDVLNQTGGTLYVGSGGVVSGNVSPTYTQTITLGNATVGAIANWSSSMPMALSGTMTFQTADGGNNPFNITLNGPLSGASAILNKTGGGTLTLGAANTYTGNTTINAGTLALTNDGVGSFGAIASTLITVASNAVFDVSQAIGYTLGSSKTLAGVGTVVGPFTAGASANISPAGAGAQGTLTFVNGLIVNNANIKMDLTSDTTGTITSNDFVNVTGDFTATGVNNFVVTPVGSVGIGTYKLLKYTGNFNGALSNLACGIGTISTNVPGEIDLVVSSPRPLAKLVWRGDGGANLWDTGASSNWLNGVSLDRFYTGDTNIFNDSTTNFVVSLPAPLLPAASSVVLVNATNDYTFTGSGYISGGTGLTKTNSGKLTIANANDYVGVTTLSGGTVIIATVADGGSPSPIGAASSSSTNLVISGGTLEYDGGNSSMNRGLTLGTGGANLNVTNAVRTLTISGNVTGPGTLIKSGAGALNLTVPNNYAGGTVISNGTLALGSNNANNDGAGGSALGATNSVVTFYGGTLQLFGYAGSTGNNYSNLFNPLVVPAGQNGTLRMWPRGPVSSGANSGLKSSLTGGGTLNLVVNYVRDNLDGDWSAFTGLINVTPKPSGSGDEMRINNSFGYSNAVIFLNDGVLMDYQLAVNATVDIGELGGTSASFIGTGSLSPGNTTWRVGWKNTSATFAGTIANDAAITKVGTGTWTLTGANTYTGPTAVNKGSLVVDGSLGNTLLTVNTGTLSGIGSVGGATTLNAGAVLAAGDSGVGTLTFNNNLTLNIASTNSFVVTTGGGVSNPVAVAGTLAPNGSVIRITSGTALAAGSYTLLTYASTNGTVFNPTPIFDVAPAASASIVDTGAGQINLVIGSSGLNFSSIVTSGSDIILNANGGTPGGPVTVLTSTNLTLPLASWTAVTSGSFDGSGNFTYTVSGALSSGQPKQFYILHTP